MTRPSRTHGLRAFTLVFASMTAMTACSTGDLQADAAHDGGDASEGGPTTCGACPVWLVRCGDRCVDLTVSPGNCSACGAACDSANQVCHGGACTAAARCTSLLTGDAGVTVVDAGATHAGLRGEYYNTPMLTDLKVVRTDPMVDFAFTGAPVPGVGATNFSVRWTGTVTPRFSEAYTFAVAADDGVRLSVDNQLVIDHWTGAPGSFTGTAINLMAGQPYFIKLEFTQTVGSAAVHLSWSSPSQTSQVVPGSALAPAAGTDSCATGSCCPSGTGQAPVCCPADTQCVQSATFTGCCPIGEDCGQGAACRT